MVVASTLALGACAADDPLARLDDAQDIAAQTVVRQPDRSSQAPVLTADKLFATITNISFKGSLCPEGAAETSANDSGVFTASLGGEMFAEGTGEAVTGDCTVTIDLTTPAGYQFNKAPIAFSAYLAGEGAKVDVTTTYAYDMVSSTKSYPVYPGIDEPGATRHQVDIWSPTCGNPIQRGRARLTAKVSATFPPGASGFLNMGGVDGALSFDGGADWRRCRTNELVTTPASPADGPCAGPHKQACQRGLACETPSATAQIDPDFAVGKCVPTTVSNVRGKKNEACGGVRQVQCDSGLTCFYREQSLVQRNLTGVCVPLVGEEDGYCGGTPNLVCGEGLGCIPSGDDNFKRCVPGAGKEDHFCGQEGLAECDPGLYCTGTRCKIKKNAFPGEPCGRPGDLECSASTRCIDNVCVRPSN